MKSFATLISTLATTTKTIAKQDAIIAYFAEANVEDKIWVIALFTGRRPKRSISSTLLRTTCMQAANIEPWLYEECYHTVGDTAETIALLLPDTNIDTKDIIEYSLTHYMNLLQKIGKENDEIKQKFITNAWAQMNRSEIFVFNKLMTGGFRIGVSQKTIVNAIAKTTNVSPSIIAHRLMGDWNPAKISFNELMSTEHSAADDSKPYPFYLAYAVEGNVSELGTEADWQAEWKWDGIRSQLIKRAGNIFIWSRGEELITNKFPEIMEMASQLPDNMVLDGEILPYIDKPLPFNVLQTRITRKNLSAKILKEAPVIFMLYDVLEWQSEDIRMLPLSKRTALGAALVDEQKHNVLKLSTPENFATWDELAILRTKSREMDAEGFMIKRKNSIYQVGRKRGDWWKWKIAPLSIDAVLIYAQKGHGRRADLYTDYTFAVWNEDKLIPFAKAYSGLSDIEIKKVDEFIKKNTKEKFGPVRTVNPELVFEIGFEGIQNSPRHKSGIAVRFPRILRWRIDKKKEEANTLEDLKSMLQVYGVTNLIV